MPAPFWQRLLPVKQWCLLAGQANEPPRSLNALTIHEPPRGRSWADPFPVWCDGRCWLFIEEVIHHPKKGRLAVMEWGHDGQPGPLQVILERPYHLSYPNVFEWDGQWWLVPESKQNRTLDAYRCVEWPHRWEHASTLMREVEIVDATFWEHGGRWWLFGGTPAERGGNASGQLSLWHADSPLSDQWTPHPANPVVADRTHARPAGRLFKHEDRLLRPAQDCSVRYGYATRLMAVEELSPDTYRETEWRAYLPGVIPGARATHTFNRAGPWCFSDFARYIWE